MSEALFSFYVSSLSRYSRFQSLLLLAYVAYCGRRMEAQELLSSGMTPRQVGRRLGVSVETVSRWVWDGPPRLPRWAKRALCELSEYAPSDVREELSRPWEAA